MTTRNLQISYSGNGLSPVARTYTLTGQSNFGIDTICAGSATTTISPALITDPDSNVRTFCFLASGDCTLHFDLTSGTDTSIALAANTPEIYKENPSGTIPVLPAPSGNDTLTFKIANAGSGTITFFGDLLVE